MYSPQAFEANASSSGGKRSVNDKELQMIFVSIIGSLSRSSVSAHSNRETSTEMYYRTKAVILMPPSFSGNMVQSEGCPPTRWNKILQNETRSEGCPKALPVEVRDHRRHDEHRQLPLLHHLLCLLVLLHL